MVAIEYKDFQLRKSKKHGPRFYFGLYEDAKLAARGFVATTDKEEVAKTTNEITKLLQKAKNSKSALEALCKSHEDSTSLYIAQACEFIKKCYLSGTPVRSSTLPRAKPEAEDAATVLLRRTSRVSKKPEQPTEETSVKKPLAKIKAAPAAKSTAAKKTPAKKAPTTASSDAKKTLSKKKASTKDAEQAKKAPAKKATSEKSEKPAIKKTAAKTKATAQKSVKPAAKSAVKPKATKSNPAEKKPASKPKSSRKKPAQAKE